VTPRDVARAVQSHADSMVAPPRAGPMIESLRAVGYDLPMAIADLIDNSIAAEARRIDVIFQRDATSPWIAIRDDGNGMDKPGLVNAMRLGSKDPLEVRGEGDLGRFGLGLKTASFSQCRRLTVSSLTRRTPSQTCCWDLDLVRQTDEWTLLLEAFDESSDEVLAEVRPKRHGTVVLWQLLDRVIEEGAEDLVKDHWYSEIARVETQLAMIYHRFLADGDIRLTVNDRPLVAWDPFLVGRSIALDVERFGDRAHLIEVRPYVLPREADLGAKDHSAAGGPRGWNAQQGFYIYRNRRLLVPGDWLGMFQPEEHHKLCRIAVDVPNTLDQAWELDIRKSVARPPEWVRRELHRIARRTRVEGRRVYGGRSAGPAAGSRRAPIPVWNEKRRSSTGEYRYVINRQHPVVDSLLRDEEGAEPARTLELIERSIPTRQIAGRYAAGQLATPDPSGDDRLLGGLLRHAACVLLKQGMPDAEVLSLLRRTDPFAARPDLIIALDLENLECP